MQCPEFIEGKSHGYEAAPAEGRLLFPWRCPKPHFMGRYSVERALHARSGRQMGRLVYELYDLTDERKHHD